MPRSLYPICMLLWLIFSCDVPSISPNKEPQDIEEKEDPVYKEKVPIRTICEGAIKEASVSDDQGNIYQTGRMEDGRIWLTENLVIETDSSWYYKENSGTYNYNPEYFQSFGRLYQWIDAQNACRSLGNKWRLPTAEEWETLIRAYDDNPWEEPLENEEIAYTDKSYSALIEDGCANFNIKLGGTRCGKKGMAYISDLGTSKECYGVYSGAGRRGSYWTSSVNESTVPIGYTFVKGGYYSSIISSGYSYSYRVDTLSYPPYTGMCVRCILGE